MLREHLKKAGLEILSGGYFFTTLLLPRMFQKWVESAKEKESEVTGIGGWTGGNFISKAYELFLLCDYFFFKIFRIVWYATMDAGEGGTNTVSDIETQYAAGESVQGACPAGWHVPTEAEVENLMSSMSTEDLMAQGLWLPDVGTNASGFNLLPSGCYNSELDRYERKSVGAYFWILTPPSAIG